MGNLNPTALAAITRGAPIRQAWTIRSPLDAAHSAYGNYVIDDGLFSAASPPTRRVIRAGKRTHTVWNESPMKQAEPSAVRYSFEVANGDGFFYSGLTGGSAWNPFGLYAACTPQECFVIHELYVWNEAGHAWIAAPYMAFRGAIISVEYFGSRQMAASSSVNIAASETATITCEQVGALTALRRKFTEADADFEKVTNATLGDFTVTF